MIRVWGVMKMDSVGGKHSGAITNQGIPWERLNILLIDDSQSTRHVIRNMLYEIGVTQIFEAQNGREAMKYTDVVDEQADIIICDWNMPNMSGIELLNQMRGACLGNAFLMMTARRDASSVLEARTAGVDGYIVKPFSAHDLKSKLAAILNGKKH